MSILKEVSRLIRESNPEKITEIMLAMKNNRKDIEPDTLENFHKSELNTSFMDILPIIPNPHAFIGLEDTSDIDPLSLIYSVFLKNSDIPHALPIFSFLSYLSAFCVNNNIMYKHPTNPASYLNSWTLILAPSGSAKTLSSSIIEKSLPKNLDDEAMIKANFEGADGSAAFIAELAKAEKKIDLFGKTIQPIFWIEDEYAQFMKKMLPNGAMAETRNTLLKVYDYDKAKRTTKKETIETDTIVLNSLFLNTIDSFARNFTEESIKDGLGRRHNFIYAERDERLVPTYEIEKIISVLKPKFDDFFSEIKTDCIYTFSKDCRKVYDYYFVIYKEKFDKILGVDTNGTFFRTYFQEAWKYAVLFHIMLNKSGTEVQISSMDYGIRVSLMFLTSIKRFVDYKIDLNSGAAEVRKEYLDKRAAREVSNTQKYADFLLNNPEISMRDFNRKFTFKKADSLKIIKTIQENKLIKYHSLFEVLAKEEAKSKNPKPTRSRKKTETVVLDDDTGLFDKI